MCCSDILFKRFNFCDLTSITRPKRPAFSTNFTFAVEMGDVEGEVDVDEEEYDTEESEAHHIMIAYRCCSELMKNLTNCYLIACL